MKKLILLLLLISFQANSQKMRSSDFIGSEWFSDCSNQDFFVKDSVQLITLKSYLTSQKSLTKTQVYYAFNDNLPITEFFFEQGQKVYFSKPRKRGWCGNEIPQPKLSWQFNELYQTITFFDKGEVKARFKIIATEQAEKEWQTQIDEEELLDFSARFETLQLVRL